MKKLPEPSTNRGILLSDNAWQALQFVAVARKTTASELVRTAVAALLFAEAEANPLIAAGLKCLGAPLNEPEKVAA